MSTEPGTVDQIQPRYIVRPAPLNGWQVFDTDRRGVASWHAERRAAIRAAARYNLKARLS